MIILFWRLVGWESRLIRILDFYDSMSLYTIFMKIIITSHTFFGSNSYFHDFLPFKSFAPPSLSPFFFFLLSRSLARTRNPKNPDHKYFAVPPIGEVDALGEWVSEWVCGDKMEEEMDFFDKYRRQKTYGEKKRKEKKWKGREEGAREKQKEREKEKEREVVRKWRRWKRLNFDSQDNSIIIIIFEVAILGWNVYRSAMSSSSINNLLSIFQIYK